MSSYLLKGKKSHQRKEDTDKGVYEWYDKYTPLNTSREKIYQECTNTEIQKVGIRPPHTVNESGRIDKSNYFHFHKRHGHNTNDYIQLKDMIEVLIKK